MMNCEQATQLLSESQERKLSTSERTVLRMHTWMCTGCRNFGGQLGFMRQAMKGFSQRQGELPPAGGEGDEGDGPPPPSSV